MRLIEHPDREALTLALAQDIADALGMAQKLLTTTLLSQKAIARQVGVCQAQISVWMRKRGWARPAVEQDGWAPRYTGFGERRPRLSRGARRFAAEDLMRTPRRVRRMLQQREFVEDAIRDELLRRLSVLRDPGAGRSEMPKPSRE